MALAPVIHVGPPSQEGVPPCKHTGRPTVHRRRHFIRSTPYVALTFVCSDCGAVLGHSSRIG